MNEQENIAIVPLAYEYFQSGNIQAFLELYAGDVDFELPAIANVPFTGKRKGRAAVGKFCQLNGSLQEALKYNALEFIAQGEKIVVLGNQKFRVRSPEANTAAIGRIL